MNNTYCFIQCNNGCTNAPQRYVIRTWPVLSNIDLTDGVKANVVPVLQRYAMQTCRRVEVKLH
jgi:hypothetical protein